MSRVSTGLADTTAPAALKVNYADDGTANDLDTDARRVAAANATNTALNTVITALVAAGVLKA